jgi:hypothetical protein
MTSATTKRSVQLEHLVICPDFKCLCVIYRNIINENNTAILVYIAGIFIVVFSYI